MGSTNGEGDTEGSMTGEGDSEGSIIGEGLGEAGDGGGGESGPAAAGQWNRARMARMSVPGCPGSCSGPLWRPSVSADPDSGCMGRACCVPRVDSAPQAWTARLVAAHMPGLLHRRAPEWRRGRCGTGCFCTTA